MSRQHDAPPGGNQIERPGSAAPGAQGLAARADSGRWVGIIRRGNGHWWTPRYEAEIGPKPDPSLPFAVSMRRSFFTLRGAERATRRRLATMNPSPVVRVIDHLDLDAGGGGATGDRRTLDPTAAVAGPRGRRST